MCVAIDRLLQNHPYYAMLMDAFFSRDIGNDGKKVVIKPADPMSDALILESMDEKAKQDMESMKNRVLELTQGLKVYFKNNWDTWVSYLERNLQEHRLHAAFVFGKSWKKCLGIKRKDDMQCTRHIS